MQHKEENFDDFGIYLHVRQLFFVSSLQEPIENLDGGKILDVHTDNKLHMIFGGTKVVQHTPPPKTSGGLKGIGYCSCSLYI